MKKIIFVFFIFLTLFYGYASNVFSMSAGPTISKSDFSSYNEQLKSIGLNGSGNSVALGVEIRTTFLNFFRFDFAGELTVIDKLEFNGKHINSTVGKKMLFFKGTVGFVVACDFEEKFGMGFGLNLNPAYFFTDSSFYEIFPEKLGEQENFFYALLHSNFSYRVSFDLLLGPTLRVGVAFTIPTNFNIDSLNFSDLNPFDYDFEDKVKASLCLQLRIF